MDEVLLGVSVGILGVLIWLCNSFLGVREEIFKEKQPHIVDLDPIIEELGDFIGGQINDAVGSLEKPNIQDHLMGMATMWFQRKMMREEGLGAVMSNIPGLNAHGHGSTQEEDTQTTTEAHAEGS